MALTDITHCKIYPGIGVARLGDSPDEFFIGPESPGIGPQEDAFKDGAGRVKRQAARFRIYGFDAAGNAVAEITANTPGARVAWRVELANTKAAGLRFAGVRHGMAMDENPDPKQRRNLKIEDRDSLTIRPTPRLIAGANQEGRQFEFSDGAFVGKAVYLGELRTDADGRLLVLGGRGTSGSVGGARPITQYANNDGWHDDTADGPVQASVSIDGRDLPVTGSWVIVAPPKFAPFIHNIVTLYDVMAEAKGVFPPDRPSFTKHIFPIFEAAAALPWVNAMALRGHGPHKAGDFSSGEMVERLNDASESKRSFRQHIFERMREPGAGTDQANYNFMPLLSGDEGDATVGTASTWLSLTAGQYAALKQWVLGNFDDDWQGPPSPAPLETLPVAEQPAALDRAALEWCVGGPFFPGIEITYVARYPHWYVEPFRFDAAKLAPGDVTKRMAVPWQADFYECAGHWWPAQRPDEVLNEATLRQALTMFPTEAAAGALAQAVTGRISWARGVGDRWANPEEQTPPHARPPLPGDNDMVTKWKTLGFVVPRRTDAGETLHVEVGRSRYEGLHDRDYFYYLLNVDSYPDFLPKARALAEQFLSAATVLLDDPTPGAVDDIYRYFPYSAEALSQRLDEIYDVYRAEAAKDPFEDSSNLFRTKEDVVERIRQFAPLNQLDGAWVRNIARPGPIDEVGALLFSIWMDEVGDGNPEQNHANVYTNLLAQVGIQLPPINTRDYVDNPQMLDSAYTVPMFELAISQFTERFYPEILGMSLQLEWEVLALWPTVKILRNFGIDPHFYELHIGIDNAANGHGAKARQAVDRFLDEARQRGGDAEVQAIWKRIWTGYVAFATTGTLGSDLRDLLERRRTSPDSPADKVAAIMAEKARYGSLNHGDKKANGQYIDDLFEDAGAFCDALVKGGYIVPGHPEQSRFFQLTSFSGPMYKVFTDEELDTWKEWTVWLATAVEPQPIVTDPARLMAACIDHLRAAQQGTSGHLAATLAGPDPDTPGQMLTQPVSAWFEEPTAALMAALANPNNGFITPGNSATSRFVTALIQGNGAMARAFQGVAPNSGGLTWRQVATQWIDAGCPPLAAPRLRAAQMGGPVGPAVRLSLTASRSVVDTHPRARVQGMGVVH